MSRLDWQTDGQNWPLRQHSRFVTASGLRWHVQTLGSGDDWLMLHGTGASTHSWRALAPLLAAQHRVVMPDLPGHGFTDPLPLHRRSLPGMARAVAALVTALPARPRVVVGHSAGAAVLARMCLDGLIAPDLLVALNGAILPLGGAAASLFSPIARVLAAVPVVPWLFARRAADPALVARLLRDTGSRLDDEGVQLYARLVRSPGHVAGALGMMAGWDLAPLARDLPKLRTKLLLIVGAGDRTVPPADAARIQAQVAGSELVSLEGLGHLAHEERPADIATLLEGAAATG